MKLKDVSDSELTLVSLAAIIGCNWPWFLSALRNVPDIYCRLVTQTPARELESNAFLSRSQMSQERLHTYQDVNWVHCLHVPSSEHSSFHSRMSAHIFVGFQFAFTCNKHIGQIRVIDNAID